MSGRLFQDPFRNITNPYILTIILLFAWVFVESNLLNVFGTTPGKWLMGIRVLDSYGHKLNFSMSIKRSLLVWVKGLGLTQKLIHIFHWTNGVVPVWPLSVML